MSDTEKVRKLETAPKMFRAHIYGIIIGNAIGIIVAAAIKKYLVPALGLDESPMEKLAGLIKDLPAPEVKDDLPHRVSRTSPPSAAS
jgi:hypothetical protein